MRPDLCHYPGFAVIYLLRLLVLLLSAVSLHGAAASRDATYAGTSACTDCAGQEMVITLFADGSFRMRTRALPAPQDGEATLYDTGHWGRDDAGRLVLNGGREAPMLFAPTRGGGLRPLDNLGRPMDERRQPALQRQAEVQWLEGPMRLRGLFKTQDDTSLLTECRTGRRWPVLVEGQHLALQRAYLAHRAQGGGEWVLAAFNGSFVQREPGPGLPPNEFIRVESFERLWPGETCAADAPATAALLNTLWRLVEIDGQAVTVSPGQREPRLQLSTEGNRVRGQTRCQALTGRFEQGSDGFLFKDLAVDGPPCAGPVAEQEARLLAALRATASRRIVGDALQLRDGSGALRLRFEALYLR